MTIVWQKQSGGCLYEVRSAGRSLRLYTDGVFHTQYNSDNPLTGHIWDLLMLPAFFYEPNAINRVLVLGVGGGASIQLIKQFVGPETIVGVELNPTHIYVDLFGEKNGEPIPVSESNANWFHQLLRHVTKDGLIVKNFLDKKSAQSSAGLTNARINQKFSSIFQLTTQYNENVAVAYLRRASTSRVLRKHLVSTPGLNPNLKTSRLRYEARRLK
jgi:hypothetical protein